MMNMNKGLIDCSGGANRLNSLLGIFDLSQISAKTDFPGVKAEESTSQMLLQDAAEAGVLGEHVVTSEEGYER